jgi:LacI family transcriptional regulator
MSRKPKHQAISSQLRAEIAAGRFGLNDRLPSETQLVATFGVSRPTAARALRDLQAEGLIERRAGSGTYLRTGAAEVAAIRQLGLLVPGLETTEIFGSICGELASLCRAHDYSLLWGGSTRPHADTDSSQEHSQEICRHFIDHKVNGVFFAPYELVAGQEETNRQLAELLRGSGIPVVLLDRDVRSFPQRSDFDLVGVDNFAAGFMLARHLLSLGCDRIRFVARPLSAPTVNARITGVLEALTQHHLQPAPNWVCLGNPADLKFVRSLTAGNLTDAFICANDLTAARLMQSLGNIGLRVPQDVRVAGFDDVKFATLLSVPLTTIHQPCQGIATVAFDAMLERISGKPIPPRSLMLTPSLVVRESCGNYLSKKGASQNRPR